MGVRLKKGVRSVKRKVRIRPHLDKLGNPTETVLLQVKTESKPL